MEGSCRGLSTPSALTANILSIDVYYFFDAGGPDDVSAHALSAITDEDRLAISRRCYRKVTKTRTFRADILPRLREQERQQKAYADVYGSGDKQACHRSVFLWDTAYHHPPAHDQKSVG